MYHIRLPQFEGPLDLLLSLIEKEKLDITEVSLSQVTDQYLACIREKQALTLANLGNFLAVAAQLLLIKSRALLPTLETTPEEEMALEDLEERLRQYQRFREAARTLAELSRKNGPLYPRESFAGLPAVYYPPESITAEVLRSHFENVLGEIPLAEPLEESAIETVVTLEEKILSFQEHLLSRVESSFLELTKNSTNRVELIVSFLAILELVKQSFLSAEQELLFTDIRLKRLARV